MASKNINLIVQWEGQDEMNKKPEPKNDFFLIEMNLVNGILKIKDPNFGIYLMVKKTLESILEHFLLVIGRKWIFGNTLC